MSIDNVHGMAGTIAQATGTATAIAVSNPLAGTTEGLAHVR
jgi:hypothetical protein